jgi:membrane-bound lytic murein transglycosylase D
MNLPSALAQEKKSAAPTNIEDFDQLGPFPVEAGLKRRVHFWIDIYSKYSKWDMVMHDANYPHIIFGVLPMRSVRENPRLSHAQKQNEVRRIADAERKEISAIFKKLHENQTAIANGSLKLNDRELKIYRAYSDVTEKDKFLSVLTGSKRIRRQYGLKESFLEGLYESGRYLPGMKQIATKLGLPTEIAYLPFLESGFDRKALSKVGASGLWQFMPGTGKFFLRVDDVVDERNDPMKAAEGAALLMRDNYQALEEWPLAITAYNHGRSGVARGVRTVKSKSLAKIIAEYDGPNFGFASSNFYCAFLAALHVAQNADHYFGEVDRAEPMVFDEFVMPEYMAFSVLAKQVGIELEQLKHYNPGLTAAVYSGKKRIPVGYTLRIPFDRREDFLGRYRSIPAEFRFSNQLDSEATARHVPAREEEL